MKRLIAAGLFALLAAPLGAADQTWTGQISDSMCKAKHEEAAEGQGRMADHDCTVSCVKGGSKYVLIVDGRIYQIANQDNKDLPAFAGQRVTVAGQAAGDSITVAKIEAVKE